MRFGDASAIVPLVALEKETGDCRTLLAEDSDIVVWLLTPVEVVSALTRRLREKSLKPREFSKAKEQLAALEKAWAGTRAASARNASSSGSRLFATRLRAPDLRGKSPRLPFYHSGSTVSWRRREGGVSRYRSLMARTWFYGLPASSLTRIIHGTSEKA